MPNLDVLNCTRGLVQEAIKNRCSLATATVDDWRSGREKRIDPISAKSLMLTTG